MAAAGTPYSRQPVGGDGQVIVLVEGVEGQPQAEALGERDLLLGGLAGMDVSPAIVLGLQVLVHEFRHQVAAVRGGVEQQVVRRARHRAVEDALQRLVAGLARLEGKVVAEDDEALAATGDEVDDVGQVDEVVLVHLDQAQALPRDTG
jgi:hypothetical protein